MTRNGFTLVEMMVALLIFGMLSAAGVALLSFGVETRGRAAQRFDDVAALTRMRSLMTADFAQAAARTHRDSEGRVLPAFSVGADGSIGLVRRGWMNDDGYPRASMQRVAYRVKEGRLERISWPRIDGSAAGEAALVDEVVVIRVRMLGEGEWREVWDPEDINKLPQAIDINIEFKENPPLRQMFLVGTGGA